MCFPERVFCGGLVIFLSEVFSLDFRACAGMTVMRYFRIRFMLRILFFQKIQRQALQEYRRKERSNKIENCDSLGSWIPGLKLQRFFFS